MSKRTHQDERQIDWITALADAVAVMHELKPYAENQLGERLHKAIAKAEAAIIEFRKRADPESAEELPIERPR